MSLYKETQGDQEIKTWLAARSITFTNPPNNATPVLYIDEVKRTSINGVVKLEESTGRNLTLTLQDSPAVIPLINPDTYEQILDADGNPVEGQTVTDQQIAYLIASVYIYAAEQADKPKPAGPGRPG